MKIIQKIKCFFGFHNLVVSVEEQKLLDEAMKNPIAQLCGLNRTFDGKEIIFKICKHCGVPR